MGGTLQRVDQFSEPDLLLTLLGGRLLTLTGQSFDSPKKKVRLLQVRSRDGTIATTSTFECPSVEVAYMNSNDCFVLLSKKQIFVWSGMSAPDVCKQTAQTIADWFASAVLSKAAVNAEREGAESTSFWSFFPSSYHRIIKPVSLAGVRYFLCSNVNMVLTAQLQARIVQADFTDASVAALVDLGDRIMLRFAADATTEFRILLCELGLDYAKQSGRASAPVWVIEEGYEPIEFTCLFHCWYPALCKKNSGGVPYFFDDAKKPFQSATEVVAIKTKKYTVAQLKDKDNLPEGVDARFLERYLLESEFPQAFGVTFEEFQALPNWKRTELKKQSVLF